MVALIFVILWGTFCSIQCNPDPDYDYDLRMSAEEQENLRSVLSSSDSAVVEIRIPAKSYPPVPATPTTPLPLVTSSSKPTERMTRPTQRYLETTRRPVPTVSHKWGANLTSPAILMTTTIRPKTTTYFFTTPAPTTITPASTATTTPVPTTEGPAKSSSGSILTGDLPNATTVHAEADQADNKNDILGVFAFQIFSSKFSFFFFSIFILVKFCMEFKLNLSFSFFFNLFYQIKLYIFSESERIR